MASVANTHPAPNPTHSSERFLAPILPMRWHLLFCNQCNERRPCYFDSNEITTIAARKSTTGDVFSVLRTIVFWDCTTRFFCRPSCWSFTAEERIRRTSERETKLYVCVPAFLTIFPLAPCRCIDRLHAEPSWTRDEPTFRRCWLYAGHFFLFSSARRHYSLCNGQIETNVYFCSVFYVAICYFSEEKTSTTLYWHSSSGFERFIYFLQQQYYCRQVVVSLIYIYVCVCLCVWYSMLIRSKLSQSVNVYWNTLERILIAEHLCCGVQPPLCFSRKLLSLMIVMHRNDCGTIHGMILIMAIIFSYWF